eukprot:gene12112-biopygen2547
MLAMFCASLTFAWIAIASLTQWEGVYGQTQTNLPVNDYRGVASDASGTNLIAIVEAGPIYFSTDGGVSWDISDAPDTEEYDCVASSSSGQYVIAAAPTTTFVSSNYGRNWTQSLNVGGASNCVGVSNSGQYMVSASALEPTNACVSYSTDYGASFTTNLGPSGSNLASGCVGVGMDASGTYVVLSVSSEGLWVSSDVTNAASWELTYPTPIQIEAIAFGGSSFYAGWVNPPHNIIQSTDYGASWTVKSAVSTGIQSLAVDSTGTKWEGVYGQTQTNLPNDDYRGLASDASGTNLIAIVEAGPIYFSSDGGVSWDISDAPDTEECKYKR